MPLYRLDGYAIVSRDDRIADADGAFPEGLRNEADQAHFQAALDAAALTLLGRRSHESAPNAKGRRRIVMSRTGAGLAQDSEGAWWWDPGWTTLVEALARIVPKGGTIAVPGGQDVFDHVAPAGFDAFHLARAHSCTLPGGRGLFGRCEDGVAAEALLSGGGLRPGPTRWLDEIAGVSLTVWRRP